MTSDNIVNSWYHVNASGKVDIGWFTDETGKKFHSCDVEGDDYGKMTTGFYLDTTTSKIYLFDQNGYLQTGWKAIGDKWFYFDTTDNLGALLVNTVTPDGYIVGPDGTWVN